MINEASESVLEFGRLYFTDKYTRDFINQDLQDKYNVPKNSVILTFPFAQEIHNLFI